MIHLSEAALQMANAMWYIAMASVGTMFFIGIFVGIYSCRK